MYYHMYVHAQTCNNIKTYSEDMYSLVIAYTYISTVHTYMYIQYIIKYIHTCVCVHSCTMHKYQLQEWTAITI